MKKVTVLVLLMVLNIGTAASDLILQNGFESGWPNAWAEAAGWSAFVVKDKNGTLVGPVVGWWTDASGETDGQMVVPVGVPLVATIIDGEKVIFKTFRPALLTGKRIYFESPFCEGQAYLCQQGCPYEGSTDTDSHVSLLRDVLHAIDSDKVLYRAEGPFAAPGLAYESVNWITVDSNGQIGQCENTPSMTTTFPAGVAQPVVNLNTLFLPPFSLE